MPAKSEKQKKFFQLVLAYKEGEVGEDEVGQGVIDAAEDMSKEEIKKFATEPVEESMKESELRRIIREELVREETNATADKLSQVDRHTDAALELNSPDAHPKVGSGDFYKKPDGSYRFSTMKYDKTFDSLEDASKWFQANNWRVTGAGPIHQ